VIIAVIVAPSRGTHPAGEDREARRGEPTTGQVEQCDEAAHLRRYKPADFRQRHVSPGVIPTSAIALEHLKKRA
jgi:hypothetical protein